MSIVASREARARVHVSVIPEKVATVRLKHIKHEETNTNFCNLLDHSFSVIKLLLR